MSRVLIDPRGYVLLRGGKLALGQEADPCCCTPEPPPGNCVPFWHFTCRAVPTRLVCCSWGDAFSFRLRASSWLRATLTRAGRELVQPDGSVTEFYPPPAGGGPDVEAVRDVDLSFTVRREAGGGNNYAVLAAEGSYRHRWVRWRYTGDILSGAGRYDVLADTTDPFALRGGLTGLARPGSGMVDFGWIADFGGLWMLGAATGEGGIFPRVPEAPCSGYVDRVYLPGCDRYGGQFGRPWTEGGYDGQGGCDSPDRTLRLTWAGDTSCASSALAAGFGYTIGGSRQVGDSGPATWTSVGRFEGELTASLEVVTSVPCVVPSCATLPPPGPIQPPPPPPPDPGEGGGGTGGGGGGGGGTSPPPPPPPPQPTGCCLQPGPAGPRSVAVGGLTSAACLRAGGSWLGPGTTCPGGSGGGSGAGAFAGGSRGAGQGCQGCGSEALGTDELVRRIRRGGV